MVMALGLLLGALLSTGTPASAATTSGKAYAWGDNTYGQLGNGTNDPKDVPVQVKKLTDVKAISAGCDHNLALKKDGSVWAWGFGTNGELGNGSRASRNVPVKVASLGTGVRRVAAGYYFSLALMNDGTVRSWGYNYYGELGDGTYGPSASKATPVAVKDLSGVRALATDSSAEHVLALLDDGTVRAWGYNYYGQLGDGTWLNFRVTPVAVTDLTGVTQVAVAR